MMGIGTGSAYNAAKLWGNSNGVPGIGEVEGESGAEITRPRRSVAVSVAFVTGFGLELGFELRFKVGEDSEEIVRPHLGKKHDVNLTADASGRSKSNTLLFSALLRSAEEGDGSRITGMK